MTATHKFPMPTVSFGLTTSVVPEPFVAASELMSAPVPAIPG